MKTFPVSIPPVLRGRRKPSLYSVTVDGRKAFNLYNNSTVKFPSLSNKLLPNQIDTMDVHYHRNANHKHVLTHITEAFEPLRQRCRKTRLWLGLITDTDC